jgi:thymidylate synthase
MNKIKVSELNTLRWQKIIKDILVDGHSSRNTKEMIGMQQSFDMNYPVISCPGRRLNTNFMIAEAAWILSGSNDISFPVKYMKIYETFSDNKVIMSGAYGPAIFRQMHYVLDTLHGDIDSRQAVLTIWTERPQQSKDIPCTVSLQFIVRDAKLHCIANMRSSDVYLGLPYDIFVFSMIATNIANNLGVDLGYLTWQAGSAHVYNRDYENAANCLEFRSPGSPKNGAVNYNVERHLKDILDGKLDNWVINDE